MLPGIPGLTSGEVAKVRILSFQDEKRKIPNSPNDEFTVMYNPTSYAHQIRSEYTVRQGRGSQRTEPVFNIRPPESFKLDLILDGTHASNPPLPGGIGIGLPGAERLLPSEDVRDLVNKFFAVTSRIVGDSHRPPFLVIMWGDKGMGGPDNSTLECVLTSADVNYTLFRSDGVPLRAKITANFLTKNREVQVSSPDLTHRRHVEEGENLPLLADQIYQNPSHYFELARFNKIKHFRQLKVGRELRFPPLDNEEVAS